MISPRSQTLVDPSQAVVFVIGGVLFLFFATSPLAGFALAWVVLAFARPLTGRTLLLCGALIAVSLSLCYASRRIGGSPYDDFYNSYYPAFLAIKNGTLRQSFLDRFVTFEFSDAEIGLPLLFGAIGSIPVEVSGSLLIFILTGACSALYLTWLLKYFLPEIPSGYRPAAALLCMSLFSYGLCSQTARQMLSIPLLLMAIWERRPGVALLLAGLGSIFHVSAMIVWIVAIVLRNKFGIGFAVLLLGLIATYFNFDWIMASIASGTDFGIDKLLYYTSGNEDAFGFDAQFVPIFIFVTVGAFLMRRYRAGEISRVLLFAVAAFFLLLPLPLASFRLTLFVSAALLGPIVCLVLTPRLSSSMFAAICAAMSLFMIGRRVFIVDSSSGMELWHQFSAIESAPFAYLGAIVQ